MLGVFTVVVHLQYSYATMLQKENSCTTSLLHKLQCISLRHWFGAHVTIYDLSLGIQICILRL